MSCRLCSISSVYAACALKKTLPLWCGVHRSTVMRARCLRVAAVASMYLPPNLARPSSSGMRCTISSASRKRSRSSRVRSRSSRRTYLHMTGTPRDCATHRRRRRAPVPVPSYTAPSRSARTASRPCGNTIPTSGPGRVRPQHAVEPLLPVGRLADHVATVVGIVLVLFTRRRRPCCRAPSAGRRRLAQRLDLPVERERARGRVVVVRRVVGRRRRARHVVGRRRRRRARVVVGRSRCCRSPRRRSSTTRSRRRRPSPRRPLVVAVVRRAAAVVLAPPRAAARVVVAVVGRKQNRQPRSKMQDEPSARVVVVPSFKKCNRLTTSRTGRATFSHAPPSSVERELSRSSVERAARAVVGPRARVVVVVGRRRVVAPAHVCRPVYTCILPRSSSSSLRGRRRGWRRVVGVVRRRAVVGGRRRLRRPRAQVLARGRAEVRDAVRLGDVLHGYHESARGA